MTDEKTVKRKTVILFGVICVSLILTGFGLFTYYFLLVKSQETIIQSKNDEIQFLTSQNSQLEVWLNDNMSMLNLTRYWLSSNITYYNSKIVELQNQIQTLNAEINSKQALITTLQNQLSDANANIQELQENIRDSESEIRQLNEQILSLNEQISALHYQISSLETQLSTIKSVGIHNPTYSEMLSFIQSDQTDMNSYTSSYNCVNFAADVVNHAYSSHIECGFVYVEFASSAHAIICFSTVDNGLIYIEPQTDEVVSVHVGSSYLNMGIVIKLVIAW